MKQYLMYQEEKELTWDISSNPILQYFKMQLLIWW